MQKINDILNKLEKKEKLLLFLSLALMIFVIVKLFIVDIQKKNIVNHQNIAKVLVKHEASLNNSSNSNSRPGSFLASNILISNQLKSQNISDRLKNIRNTSNDLKRFELENIEFNQLIDLLASLEKNQSVITSVQVKDTKTPGLVNAVLITQ